MSLRTRLRETVDESGFSLTVPTLLVLLSERVLTLASTYERELWLLVVVTMLADVPLTMYGLQLGLTEMNPVARTAIEVAGALGLYMLELVALSIGLGCTLLVPQRYTALVPLGLALPSVFAVVVNSLLIFSNIL
jgi:hypothetical protein